MTTAELRKATREFDDPAYQPPALPQTAADVAQQQRARNKGGRPRKGLGARTISLTVEKALPHGAQLSFFVHEGIISRDDESKYPHPFPLQEDRARGQRKTLALTE